MRFRISFRTPTREFGSLVWTGSLLTAQSHAKKVLARQAMLSAAIIIDERTGETIATLAKPVTMQDVR